MAWELPILDTSTMPGERVRNVFQLRGEPAIRAPAPITE